VQALAEFDIKSKKATTLLNRGQLMLQASHDQLVAKVRSILENQSCDNNSIDHQAEPTAPSAGPQIYPLLTFLSKKKVNLISAGPNVNVHGGTSSLDSIVDLISASVIPTAHPQTTTTDAMTSEPAVLTQTQHQLPNEVPSTRSFPLYCTFINLLTTIL
jgi:hypothetical protein